MTKPLPIAIVIPHGGLAIPPELQGHILLTEEQIFNEADVYVDAIYDFRERVLHWVSFPYARALIDVNRPAENAQHHRPGDGVVKRQTSYGAPVFAQGKEPDPEFEQKLIQQYWQPWHDQLARIASDDRVKLVLDCHSMAAIGPSTYDDPSQIRPRITASNLGDAKGNATSINPTLSASAELTRSLADELGMALATISDLAPTEAQSAVNTPFWGGVNIAMHGGKLQPWVMLELNRGLYIGAQTGDSPVVPPDTTLFATIREQIWSAIEKIAADL